MKPSLYLTGLQAILAQTNHSRSSMIMNPSFYLTVSREYHEPCPIQAYWLRLYTEAVTLVSHCGMAFCHKRTPRVLGGGASSLRRMVRMSRSHSATISSSDKSCQTKTRHEKETKRSGATRTLFIISPCFVPGGCSLPSSFVVSSYRQPLACFSCFSTANVFTHHFCSGM